MCLAVPGLVEAVDGEGLARSARVDFGGVRRTVSLACLPGADVGDYVLVHAGIGIATVDPVLARRSLEALEAMQGPP
ncbi:MAG: HypC/HybG/HupF family hydrogenase formation chaperone [Gammaproteobacteria bacterium]